MGAKFYKELNKVKHLCAHMDIFNEEMQSKPVRLLGTLILYLITNVTFIKSTVYV